MNNSYGYAMSKFLPTSCFKLLDLKACVCYFSLFKKKCLSLLFQTNYIEKKFNLQLFFLPIVT